MRKMGFLFLLLFLNACSMNSANDLPGFQTSSEAISAARSNFVNSENNFLGLLMVDRDGNVVRVRRLASKLDDFEYDRQVINAMYQVEFVPAEQGEKDYREFVFPFAAGTSNIGSAVVHAFEPSDMGGFNDQDPNNPR